MVTQAYAEKPETPDSPPPLEGHRLATEKPLPTTLLDYNTKLDKFNQNLSDLQTEINRLSLQQEQIKQTRAFPQVQQRNVPHGHTQPPLLNTTAQMNNSQNASRGPEISYNPQHMQPQQVPVGPVVPSQNQFMPVTCTGHHQYTSAYNGYQQGFSPSYPYSPVQQQMFLQSPPYPVAPHLGTIPLTSTPHGVIPAFSPMGPGIPTPTLQPSVLPSSHVGAQIYQHQTQSLTNYPQVTPNVTNIHSTFDSRLPGAQQNIPQTFGQPSLTSHTIPAVAQTRESSSSKDSNAQLHSDTVIPTDSRLNNVSFNQSDEKENQQTSNQNEFFVSFNDGTPKPKPELGKNRKKSEQVIPTSEEVNSNQNQSLLDNSSQKQDATLGSDVSSQNLSGADGQNISGIGFVIGQDETSIDQTEAEEIQRKKEKLIQLQLKRKEEQEKKRQYKDIEMSRRKEQDRLKQEQAEQRKLEEKLRREEIFRQYQEKKHAEEEETKPVVKREKSLRQKPRPQSMFVKPNGKPTPGEALHTSQEDLSENKVSCNTLTSSADAKSLAFGGLTHRTRPPSPDLHGRSKMSASGSSETGSMSGSDYSGPKLYVKPSSKSNKSIIHNAISHCCLAGSVNTSMKNKVIEVLEGSEGTHFMILFRDHSCQYRSLYMYHPDTDFIIKLHGVGPNRITNSMIEKFYKYNSGGKKFTEVVSTKHLSVSIDAVVIQNSLWKTQKMAAKNK